MQRTLKNPRPSARRRLNRWLRSVKDNGWLYALALPALVYLVIFHYMPMYGVQIAFRDDKSRRESWAVSGSV